MIADMSRLRVSIKMMGRIRTAARGASPTLQAGVLDSHATVHRKHLPGNVTTLFRSEEIDHSSDIGD